MKIKKVLVCLSLTPISALGCPELTGSWTSSLDKFVAFNQKWSNVDAQAWLYMQQTQGMEVINFVADNEMVIRTPQIELKFGEKSLILPASEEHISFDILGCTRSSVVLAFDRYNKKHLVHWHFENHSTFWQYMGDAEQNGNSHIREYYVRNAN